MRLSQQLGFGFAADFAWFDQDVTHVNFIAHLGLTPPRFSRISG
jgi:hypothetical protein